MQKSFLGDKWILSGYLYNFISAKGCASDEETPIAPGNVPSGFTVNGEDVLPDGTVRTDGPTTTVTVTNDDPENTDAVPMTVSGKITPKDTGKSPTDDDVKVTVTVTPKDGSTPIPVPEDAVSFTFHRSVRVSPRNKEIGINKITF